MKGTQREPWRGIYARESGTAGNSTLEVKVFVYVCIETVLNWYIRFVVHPCSTYSFHAHHTFHW